MPNVKPILLALVLCDTAIREQGTGKLSLIGTFSAIFTNNFPCTHNQISVYVALTEGRSRVPCKLRMVSLSSNQMVFELPGQIDFGGPMAVAELVFQLQQVRFEQPGVYAIEFWADGELLGSRKLNVQKLEPRPARPA